MRLGDRKLVLVLIQWIGIGRSGARASNDGTLYQCRRPRRTMGLQARVVPLMWMTLRRQSLKRDGRCCRGDRRVCRGRLDAERYHPLASYSEKFRIAIA
jgi:hypothetical protein